MIHAHIDKNRGIPWWAVVGAPLIGVPALVGLLALIAPGQQAVDEPDDVDFAVEQIGGGESLSGSMMEPQALSVLESLSFG